MRKQALVLINVGPTDKAAMSRPFMQRYCDRYDLDFIEITKASLDLRGGDPDYNYLNFEKFQAFDLLVDYERMLRLDTDVFVSPEAPNVFDCVPADQLGVVFEDYGDRRYRRQRDMERVADAFGGDAWGDRRYFNSGVMVFSRVHREAFLLTATDRALIEQGALGRPKEQNLCNWKARQGGCSLFELDYRFNHMSLFSNRWTGSPHRLGSYFIHYAGSQQRKARRMVRDHARLASAWAAGKSPLPWYRQSRK